MMNDASKIGSLNLRGGNQRDSPRYEIKEIHTIFVGPHIVGNSRHTQDGHMKRHVLIEL